MIRLLRQRNFSLLWFGGLISLTGDWMLSIALPVAVYELTGSALAVSTMVMARVLPNLLLGSVAGVFVDRWDRRRTMIAANLLLTLIVLPLGLVRSADWLWLIYVIAFAQACIVQFFRPAENALLPRLVDERDLVAANALNSLNNNLARLIGPPLGGFVAAWLGLGGVAAIDAATYLVAAGMIALIAVQAKPDRAPDTTRPSGTATLTRVWREWIDGLMVVRRSRVLVAVFLLIAITSVGEGVMSALFIVFVSTVLGGGALEVGWLVGAQAIGGLIGALLIGAAARCFSPVRLVGVGAILFGLADIGLFNYPMVIAGIVPGLFFFIMAGIPGVGLITGITTLLQTEVPDRYRGRVFGAQGTTAALMALIGLTLGGTLGDPVGIVTMLNIQGAGYPLAGLLFLLLLRHTRTVPTPSDTSSQEPVGTPR